MEEIDTDNDGQSIEVKLNDLVILPTIIQGPYPSNNEAVTARTNTFTAIPGCTNANATNYDDTANEDDGSCTYDVHGCTDSTADNYAPTATVDDGSCTHGGGGGGEEEGLPVWVIPAGIIGALAMVMMISKK